MAWFKFPREKVTLFSPFPRRMTQKVYALRKLGQTEMARDQEVVNFESSSIAIGYGRRAKFANSPVTA